MIFRFAYKINFLFDSMLFLLQSTNHLKTFNKYVFALEIIPGINTKMNCEMLAKLTIHILMNLSQNSSLKAIGFFSQKMKTYLPMIIPSKKSIICVTIEFLITNSIKQIVALSGPNAYLKNNISN